MPKLLQSTPSLGSAAGLVTMVVGVAVAMFILAQFNATRSIVSGQLPTIGGNAA